MLTLAAIFFLFLRIHNVWSLEDIWSNLATGFITIIGTIFVIDALLDKRRVDEFKDANKVTKDALLILSNNLINNILIPISDEKTHLRIFSLSKHTSISTESYAKKLLNLALTTNLIKDSLKSMELDQFKFLERDLSKVKSSLTRTTRLYYHLLSPKILGKLLMTGELLESYHSAFEMFAQSFVYNPITYRKNPKAVISLKEGLLEAMESSMRNYLTHLKELVDEIKKT